MKARIPMNNYQRSLIEKEIEILAKKEVERQSIVQMRKFFKLSACVLNENFKFGHDRILKFINSISELISQSDEDEIFWEHIDMLVIDRLQIPFDRDYTDRKK